MLIDTDRGQMVGATVKRLSRVAGSITNRLTDMGYGRPIIQCPCGRTHFFSPGAMAVVITAFVNGSMQTVGADGTITTKCLLNAFDDKEATELYDGRHVAYS